LLITIELDQFHENILSIITIKHLISKLLIQNIVQVLNSNFYQSFKIIRCYDISNVNKNGYSRVMFKS